MRRFLPLLLFLLAATHANAFIKIESGKNYRLVCMHQPGGCVVTGAAHSAVPYVYYLTSYTSVPDDGWWTVTKSGKGYTLRNAATGQYLIYKNERLQNAQGQYLAKGLQLADEATGNNALWTFSETAERQVIIQSVGTPGQYFNLRTDGSYLVGTYTSAGTSANGRYMLYNEKGESVITDEEIVEPDPDAPLYTWHRHVTDVRLGGKSVVADEDEGVLYAQVPTALRHGADWATSLTATLTPLADGMTLRLDDIAPDANDSLTLAEVSCEEDHRLSLLDSDGNEVTSVPLRLTFLPLVEIRMPSCNSSTYTTGSMRVTDADLAGYDSTVIAAFRYRGASAQNYAKKSYAIKLRDAEGNSIDREYFGLRDDNNWILDAMAIDRACMRNRVSTDLWNDFAAYPWYRRNGTEKKARTGTRGRFVEVFLNGKYHGLYCMTEKIDRKQLKLKKYVAETDSTAAEIHGVLYKSSQWCDEVHMTIGTTPRAYDNNKRSETWASWEVKYPDWEEEKIDWGPLWNAINFITTSEEEYFNDNFSAYFDQPMVRDYYLLVELIRGNDNAGKNMYLFGYDILGKKYKKCLGIAVWDMDSSWGRNWNAADLYYTYDQPLSAFYSNFGLFVRLERSTYWSWKQLAAQRYAELRTTFFQPEALIKRFTDYRDLFLESGVTEREKQRWPTYHPDIAGDVTDIATWIERRIEFLDTQYGYVPPVAGVDAAPTDKPAVLAEGGQGEILIHATRPADLTIHTADGRLVQRLHVTQPLTAVGLLPAGLYVVAGQKVVVR